VKHNPEALYREAYDAHYTERDIARAFGGYTALLEQYPDSREAGYARMQLKNLERDRAELERLRALEAPNALPPVMLTTAPLLEGFRVVRTIEVITAECVLGMNVFRDLLSGVTDIIGGRSGTMQKMLREARLLCLGELKREAVELGANAVIAVALDYNELSGQGKSMLFLVASGTAVVVEPLPTSTSDGG
jgi:uncharacterized protein YbjQ (UPF0145 family)